MILSWGRSDIRPAGAAPRVEYPSSARWDRSTARVVPQLTDDGGTGYVAVLRRPALLTASVVVVLLVGSGWAAFDASSDPGRASSPWSGSSSRIMRPRRMTAERPPTATPSASRRRPSDGSRSGGTRTRRVWAAGAHRALTHRGAPQGAHRTAPSTGLRSTGRATGAAHPGAAPAAGRGAAARAAALAAALGAAALAAAARAAPVVPREATLRAAAFPCLRRAGPWHRPPATRSENAGNGLAGQLR